MGLRREDFLIANSFWCKAPRLGMTDHPHKFPEVAVARAHCAPHLDELIARHKPSVIVPLGSVALNRATGLASIDQFHGYILNTPWGIPAIPTYHPSFMIQGNFKLSGAWMFVFKKALEIASGVTKAPLSGHLGYALLLDPTPDAAELYLAAHPDNLVCDIETYESPDVGEDERPHEISWQIVRISFSNKNGTAVSFPFSGPYIEVARRALARATSVIFWNQAFDVPLLRAAGCPVKGTIIDAMWMWHWFQSDLPKRLGFAAPLLVNVAPWKHLSHERPALYSALDSAITGDCWQKLVEILTEQGRLDEFSRQCTQMLPINQSMTDAGILIDTAAQTKLLDGDLTKERDILFNTIQSEIPLPVKPFKFYKKEPKKLKPGETAFADPDGGWIKYMPFNPGSPLQKKRLFTALGLKIPYNSKRDSETIEAKHLRAHAKKFSVLRHLIDYGERQKLITSYDWPVEADGRIHPEFGFNPSTWRKNARNPNIQTIPKRSDLAYAFRRLFIAAPGHILIECDSSAIEAVLVGYFAGSEAYIALAKRGVHKFVASEFAGRPVSKEEPLYDKVKRIVHMSNYLGSPKRIAEEYPDDFASVKEAQKLQDFYFGLAAGADVRRYQTESIALAASQNYLDTPFHQRHYFYDVLTIKDGTARMSSDAKRAVAFRPQATASAIQTEYILNLPPGLKPMLRAIIHDSIILEASAAHDTHLIVAEALYKTMTAPIPELGGLSIGAELKIGPNLGDMKEIKF
jgi:DNA polymerase I-like protein with 3'-5' exonuclease and polymerase domains